MDGTFATGKCINRAYSQYITHRDKSRPTTVAIWTQCVVVFYNRLPTPMIRHKDTTYYLAINYNSQRRTNGPCQIIKHKLRQDMMFIMSVSLELVRQEHAWRHRTPHGEPPLHGCWSLGSSVDCGRWPLPLSGRYRLGSGGLASAPDPIRASGPHIQVQFVGNQWRACGTASFSLLLSLATRAVIVNNDTGRALGSYRFQPPFDFCKVRKTRAGLESVTRRTLVT